MISSLSNASPTNLTVIPGRLTELPPDATVSPKSSRPTHFFWLAL